ncbi:hypothetical protein [Candidatus Leptofilum sp.]|uniref:hypothetical protein n=1 Tax=Candidatus Leptofilum sp. TaxID=3241576 RepID=UPI003B5AC469
MSQEKKEAVSRLIITAFVLLGGLLLLPYVGNARAAINWELFGGAYTPDLSVDENKGAPGSQFAFTGSGYQPNRLAVVFVNGQVVGGVTTDSNGTATFIIDATDEPDGDLTVVMETDANVSDFKTITVDSAEPVVSPPGGFTGPAFGTTGNSAFLPLVRR